MQTATQLLTVEDVAAELECSPLMIRRVIALGTLKGTMTKAGSIRSFRVTRANLDAFVAAGCQRLTPLPVGARHITNSSDWFADKHIAFLGRLYDEAVTAKLGEILPEPEDKLPAGVPTPTPNDPDFKRVQLDVTDAAINELLNAPAPYGTRAFPGTGRLDGFPPFAGQWRDAYLCSRFWSQLALVVSQADNVSGYYPAMQNLYQEPNDFKAFLEQAWERVQQGYLSATRRYHVAFQQTIYREPKAQLVSTKDAVQTIEVELRLTNLRIAAGRRPFVEREL